MKRTTKLMLFVVMTIVLCTLLAVFASAETYNVKYADIGGSVKATVQTDEEGKITLRDTSVTTNENKVFYGWFTQEGTFYAPNTELTVTEDTILREAFAFVATDAATLSSYVGNYNWSLVRLDADITITSNFSIWEGGGGAQSYIDLNGHTITNTGTGAVFTSTRRGFNFLNSSTTEAKIISNNAAAGRGVIEINSHGYSNGQHLAFSIGRNVTVETNQALFRVPNSYDVGGGQYCPYIRIWGKATADCIVNQNRLYTNMAEINIYSGADVTLTGTTWWTNIYTGHNKPFADVTIQDGAKITATNPDFNWLPSVEYVTFVRYDVTGGTYNVKFPDGILKYGYEPVYNPTTDLYEVEYVACTLDGSNGEHTYKVQEAFCDLSVTCDADGYHYYRCMCGSKYVDVVETLGHSYTSVTIEKVATATEAGTKRVTCEICADSYTYEYSFNPGDQIVTIVVKTADGTKEITALTSDLYNMSSEETISGFSASFNGVKTIVDPENPEVTYTIADVVKLVIPAGFTSIQTGAIKNATALEEIVLLDGANVTFGSKSIDGCTALKSIVLGDCTVTFSGNTINGNTADLTIDATKANVTTLASAFEGKTTLKHFVMGTGKSYNFAASTFKTAGIEEFVVPDYATLTAAYATCYQTNSLKYVYIGRGITSIDNIFDQCFYMQKIVLMDVTNITGQYFACLANKGEDVLRIYHHGSSLSTGNYFLHQSHGVILYTNATGYKGSMSNCSATTKTIDGTEVSYPAYTIIKGIPHEYTEGGVDATCTAMGSTGYTTDCPCGVVSDATYTTYYAVNAGTAVNGTTAVEGSITVGTTTPALGHEFYENDTEKQVIASTTEATCVKDAAITYKCARCDETLTVVQEGTATGHTPEAEWTVATEATCAADGLQQKMCTACGALAEAEIIPAIGHKATGVWVTTVEATCTVGAKRVQYCENGCGLNVLSETTEPNGHIPSEEWVIEVNTSCTKDGSKYKRCTICNAICETEAIEKLGHNFDTENGAEPFSAAYENGFDKEGVLSIKCARCDAVQDGNVLEPMFVAKGYSLSPTKTGIDGGYTINIDALNIYEAAVKKEITFGVVIANATAFDSNPFFTEDGKVGTEKSIKVVMDSREYQNFNCSISGFTESNASFNLIITAFVIDENGNESFVQHSNGAETVEIGTRSFKTVTFNYVKSFVPSQPSAEPENPSKEDE